MGLTIDQALQQGVAAHKEGKLQDAERFYKAILQSHPLHPDANHNLGVLAASVNKTDVALPLFKIALEANPKVEQFWLSYIDALIKEKQFDNAKEALEQAKKEGLSEDKVDSVGVQLIATMRVNQSQLAAEKKSITLSEKCKKTAENKKKKEAKKHEIKGISPSEAEINTLLQLYQNGQYRDAERLAVSITQEFPKHQFGWKVLGAVLNQSGRINESLAASQKSVQLAPQDADAHCNLGSTLRDLGRLDEAEASCRQAVALQPNLADAHYNLGVILKELGRLDDAEASYRRAIALRLGFVEAHYNLGVTLQELDRLDEAEESFIQAIALKPDYAEAHSNLGVTLRKLGRLDEAEASYRQAIVLKSEFAEAHNNLGNTLQELGRLEEAEASLRKAIALKPDYTEAMVNLSIILDYINDLEAEIISLQNIIQIDADNHGLRAVVNLAICNFLEVNFAESRKQLLAAAKIQEKKSFEFKTEKIYQRYTLKILNWHEDKYFDACNRKTEETLYVIGESHSLASHQLHVQHLGSDFLCKAKLIKGCKQWYLGNSRRNQYKNKFESIFYSLPRRSEVVLVIGEIDCRLNSGIIKHKNKFPEKETKEIIAATVENYLTYILKTNSGYQHNIIIQGVPCPNIDMESFSEREIIQLIEVIKNFNYELNNKSKENGFDFLDVHRLTDRGDGFSNSIWHIDNIHLSPEGFLEAWSRYASDYAHV